VCPHCRYDLARYSQLPYEDELILALRHPIRENRMLAIQLLGDLRSKSAIPVFGSILHEENNFYAIREIVRALRKIGGMEGEELLTALRKHKSKLVKDLLVEK
jgi:hypothetical protein